MPHDDPVATTLAQFADAISARDWSALRAVLADGFVATLLHTGETFNADDFVEFNRAYPGSWQYVREEIISDGNRAALRSRTSIGPDTWHAASFGSVDADGRLIELLEVWTEAVATPPDRSAPGSEQRSDVTVEASAAPRRAGSPRR